MIAPSPWLAARIQHWFSLAIRRLRRGGLARNLAVAVLLLLFAAPALALGWAIGAGTPERPVLPVLGPLVAGGLAGWATLGVYLLAVAGAATAALPGFGALARERQVLEQASRTIADNARRAREGAASVGAGEVSVRDLVTFGSASDLPRPERTNAYKMLEAIARQANALRFDPVYMVVLSHAQRLYAGSAGVRVWQSLGLRVGILFTFVGLVLSLGQVQAIFIGRAGEQVSDLPVSALVEPIGLVVANLALAFGTSVAGLLAAVLLQFVVSALSAREQAIEAEMERIAGDAQAFCRRRIGDSPLEARMGLLEAALGKHEDSIRHEAGRLDAASREIGASAADAAARLEAPIARMARDSDALARLLERQAAAIDAANTLAERLGGAERRLATAFASALEAGAAAQKEALAEHAQRLDARGEAALDGVRRAADAVVGRIEDRVAAPLERAVAALERRRAGSRAVAALVQSLGLAVQVATAALLAVLAAGLFGFLDLPGLSPGESPPAGDVPAGERAS